MDTGYRAESGNALRLNQAVLGGIVVLAITAKIKVPMRPVPVAMGSFAVLFIGARLGQATILGYMLIGALGLDVFAGALAAPRTPDCPSAWCPSPGGGGTDRASAHPPTAGRRGGRASPLNRRTC
ncbi:biotin transporter BioY [Sedimentitalea nanhaiensis]|uniref:BioY family protein n=1 Tax=Sedimentitalea nanhaiensis TaxID=999627 RepID=A0A1I6ZVP6_9RHOB|nr:biotin transporter BioY [Sedimentitalea nanhaiensis]SFT66778.1 BioY family protein [Sedimentitalea nanhaiensis]